MGNLSVTANIPDGWVRCDGNTIKEGPWKGQATPNLNNGHYFLRGGTDSEMLDTESDSIRRHSHTVSLNERYTQWHDGKCSSCHRVGRGNDGRSEENRYISGTTSTSGGDETRPKNKKVVWLMRVPRVDEP